MSYVGGNFGKVQMANHGVTKVVDIGNVIKATNTGCKLVLKDVRHVPDILLNIISDDKLDEEGYVENHDRPQPVARSYVRVLKSRMNSA